MIISLNWLKKFVDIDMPIDELAILIGARLVEIEKITYLGDKYKDVLIAKVVTAEKLEDSDHLSVTKIDDGGIANGVERDANGLIQVVCGAPNIKAGQIVAWLPPESIVPETYGKPEQFKLGIRNLRGVVSNGMIASSKELAISDEHDGILELDSDLTPGSSFSDVYELDDYLLDIENKSLTHRPDCFGIVGFAREVSAILDKEFDTPDWLLDLSKDFGSDASANDLNAVIEDSNLCPRYMAIAMSNASSNKKSPLQIQTYLMRVGVRPINAIVDVTNYLMMLTGQPLHAFDYDKVIALNDGKAEIHVRAGKDGEKLGLLDGREIEISTDDIVIASGETAIGLAGAMGGANTEIDDKTSKIIIESATFNLYKLRATQMRHGVFSEAITRFTKGQPAELAAPVLSAAVHLMNELAGAVVSSIVVDIYPLKIDQPVIEVSEDIINNILGTDLDTTQIAKTLNNAGFHVGIDEASNLAVKAPYWRSDIHIDEDVAEEVGRLNGFDNISPTLPSRSFTAVKPCDFDDFRNKIRGILVRAGANETLSYSFIHGDVLRKSNQSIDNSYKIINSISPDLQYYRQTLTPSLLNLVNSNVRQGFDNFALFEINKTHQKQDGLNEEQVPKEADMLALIITNKKKQPGAMYYQAKNILDYLNEVLGLGLVYSKIDDGNDTALLAPFESRRSARLTIGQDELNIGVIGEYKKVVAGKFKLPDATAGFEIDLRALFDATNKIGSHYRPLSRFPGSERDICFKVSKDVAYKDIIDAVNDGLKDIELESNVLPVDIYQSEAGETKNITIRIKLVSSGHTLTGDEVSAAIDKVAKSVELETNAVVI